MALLDDLSDYLTSAGTTTPINKGWFFSTADRVLCLRGTGGFPSHHVMNPAVNQAILEEPTLQLLARATTYDQAEATARSAKSLLDGLRKRTINSVVYHWATAMQPPFFLERDENQRFVFAMNVQLKRQTV